MSRVRRTASSRHDMSHVPDHGGFRHRQAHDGVRVKLVAWDVLVDNGFSATLDHSAIERHIRDGVDLIKWPPGSDLFVIRPESGKKRGEGNGVTPIKKSFIAHLKENGWVLERQRFDAHYTFHGNSPLPIVIEWETGNVSSTHRSVNRIARHVLVERDISGGIVILPSGKLKPWLTDRIGNTPEVSEYFPLWRTYSEFPEFVYLAIVTVEYDDISIDVPRIPKGTDGRARG
jgi:hypothetical protein